MRKLLANEGDDALHLRMLKFTNDHNRITCLSKHRGILLGFLDERTGRVNNREALVTDATHFICCDPVRANNH